MTGVFLIDWLALAVSLFNTSLMLWLGLTVVLNAERRGRPAWGTWLIAGALLVGSLFFISHSALISLDINTVSRGLNFWWRAGWWPVLALPEAWYVIVLWYSGYWEDRQAALRRRQRPWLWLSAVMLLGLIGLVVFANPLPSLGEFASPDPARTLAIGGVPLLILAYPAYIVLCMGLALDALLRPGPSTRVLGDLARARARPWLAAASGVLLLVTVLVAWVMLWLNRQLSSLGGALHALPHAELLTVAAFDLAIAGLIALATVLLGQALVAYEIFTGKSLPRRGLLRYWRNAVVLAGGYALVAAASQAVQLRPIYTVLVSSLLLSLFYALFSWRAYAERERYMRQVRPFVTSQRLYDHLVKSTTAGDAGTAEAATFAAQSFRALCRDVLGTRRAILVAAGLSAPLVGEPLTFAAEGKTAEAQIAPALLADLARRAESPQTLLLPVPDAEANELPPWAVPLWSERGLIGVLLLGDKSDGGLYAQEEIEIARAGGERLVDALASAELARRLLTLQRQRLSESQVLDRRARRVLHDEVLPQLHAALLSLDSQGQAAQPSEAARLLAEAHKQVSDLLRDMPASPPAEITQRGLVDALRQLVDREFAHAFDHVGWEVDPEAERHAAGLPPLAAEVLFYAAREAMRNAARYGRRDGLSAPLNLRLEVAWHGPPGPAGLSVIVEDNGPGLGQGARPATQGSGQGLALHSTLLAVLGGTLEVESASGDHTRVVLRMPLDSLKTSQ